MGISTRLAKLVLQHPSLARALKRAVRSRLFTHAWPYQKWILAKARRRQLQLPQIKPWTLIETTLTCNARCVMCVHSQRDMRGEMPLDLYEKAVREAAALGVQRLTLAIYGEPLADRQWLQRIEILRRHGFTYDFVTNGSLLTDELVERMLELGGWEDVLFSVNGFSAAVYEKMMPPLKREKVYAKVERCIEMLRQRQLAKPTVRISCVVTSINASEREEFYRYWSSKPGVSEVIMADCGTWNSELSDKEIAFGGDHRHVPPGAWLAPCPSLWGQLSVLNDGRVIPCCEEGASRNLIVGNVAEQTLEEIFRGGKLEQLRQQHLQNRRAQHPVCGKCRRNLSWHV